MQSHSEYLTHPRYRPDIDGLRAIAVLSVVIFHAFPEWLPGGFIGVDIFFVLSGFLISTILFKSLETRHFSFLAFYARRVRRLFPALLIVLSASFVAGWLFLPADEFSRLGKHIAGGAGFYANVVFWKESGYFDTAAETKPLLHLWSLGIEEQFYILWPVVLYTAWRRRWNFLLVTLLLAVGSFLLNLNGIRTQDDLAGLYYSPQTRVWELLVGAMLAYVHLRAPNPLLRGRIVPRLISADTGPLWFGHLRALAGVGMLAAGLLCISRDSLFPGWWALLPSLGTTLIISAGESAWVNRHILANRFLVGCGLISYPLYLWHWPLLSFARIMESHTPPTSVRMAAILVAVVLAWMTWRFAEKRVQTGTRITIKSAGLVVMMILTGGLGYYTVLRDGFPSRYGTTELIRQAGRIDCDDRKKESGCKFGNPAAKRLIVVYGDSHAEHLTRALNDVLGRDYRIHMVTNGSCFMGDQVRFPDVGNPKDCKAALDKLDSLRGQEIYAVIRSQRWHGYGITQKEAIERAVIDASHAHGLHPQKVIVVGSTADVDIDCEISNYYSRPLVAHQQCRTFEDIKAMDKAFVSVTRAMTFPSDIHIVYPYETICPNDACTIINGNISYYSDIHHLSKDGAMLVMPEIVKALNK